jgi:DNA-binding MurR/RpiR family transcriptional regulator
VALTSYEELRAEIAVRYGDLSKRLQQIARFALDNPDAMALETIAVIAEQADVQPSAMIRFAKAFDFEGFSEMQRVFRSRLVDRTPSYRDRIRQLQTSENDSLTTPGGILGHFVDAGIHALQHLQEEVSPEQLERTLNILAKARCIHVVGQRRAFGVAAYLVYGLSHLGRPCHLIDNTGGLINQQALSMTEGDALIAISFHSYSSETLGVAQRAAQDGIPVIAITDAPLSPLNPLAEVCFEVEDAQVRGFRSLTATMCLAVTLVVSLGQYLESRSEPAGTRQRRLSNGTPVPESR